jgi:hypothetical protein
MNAANAHGAAKARADAHRHVHDVGTRKQLAQAQGLVEFFGAQPAALLDQHSARPGHPAAETRNAYLCESQKQLGDARTHLAQGFFSVAGAFFRALGWAASYALGAFCLIHAGLNAGQATVGGFAVVENIASGSCC